MKLLLSLVGVALVAASRLSEPLSPLLPEREYIFDYDAQVLSGLPLPSEAALTRIQAQVRVQILDDRTARFGLDKIRLASAHEQQKQMIAMSSLEQRELPREHEELLRLPVQFEYRHGMISNLVFVEEDLAWSENIKRAVINMLQVNVRKAGIEKIESTEEDFFTVNEKTIEGDCEVSYTIVRDQEQTVLTKSVNHDKCIRRADISYNLRFGSECTECSEEKVLAAQTIYTHKMEKEELKEVEVRSIYTVRVLDESAMKTETVGRLTLIKNHEIRDKIEEPMGERKELIYSTEWEETVERFFKNGDEVKPFKDFTSKVELVQKYMNELVAYKENTPETVHLMARLVRLFRMSSTHELNKIHERIYERSNKNIRVIQQQILAIAGTKNTIEHLFEHIDENRVLNSVNAAQLLKSIQETPYPSEKIVELLHKFSQTERVMRDSVIRQSVWLAYGAVVRGVVATRLEQPLISENSRELKEKLMRPILKQLEKSDNVYEKVLAIKTLANAAIDISVFDLEKIIVDKNEHTTVRMEAMSALRHFTEIMPRKIHRLALPIYMDRNEKQELRMAALWQIIKSQPNQAVLAQIVMRIDREPNQQIAAFTYSLLSELAKSTNPCDKRVASVTARLLENVRFELKSKMLNDVTQISFFTEELLSGASIKLASIFGKDSVVPKEMMASVDSLLAGNLNKYLAQVGFSHQNVEKLVSKVMKKMYQMEEEMPSRARRVQETTKLVKDIAKKLGVRARAESNEEPHAMLYFRYKNMDYAVLPINEELLNEFVFKYIVDGKLDSKVFERIFNWEPEFELHQAAFFYETTKKIPTTVGLPLTITAKQPTIFSAKGSLKVEKIGFGIRARVQVQPTLASTSIFQMNVWTPLFEQGMKHLRTVESNIPVDMEIQVTYNEKLEVTYKQKNPEESKTLIRYTARPVAFIRFPRTSDLNEYTETEEKTIVIPTILREQRPLSYEKEFTGMKVIFRGDKYNQWNAEQILLGEQYLELVVEPTRRSTSVFETKLIIEPITEGRIEKPELENFMSEKLEINEFENERRSENDRRENLRELLRLSRSEGYKHRVFLVVKGEEKSELEVVSECEKEFRYCRMSFMAVLPTGERGEWKMHSETVAILPKTVSDMNELKVQKHREVQIMSKVHWGSQNKNEMTMKMQLEQSREQRNWLSLETELTGMSAYDVLVRAARLNQLKTVVDYKLSRESETYFERMFDLLKSYTFWCNKVERTENELRRVTFTLTVDPVTLRHTNLTLATPEQNLFVKDLRVPRVVLPTIVRNNVFNMEFYRMNKAVCEVQSRRINTFDEVIYRAPLTTCYSVVVKDCSEEPRYVVLVKKMFKNSEEKKMKVINKDTEYEFEFQDDELIVKKDNKKMMEKHYRTVSIEKISDSLMKMETRDITVYFDGYTVRVETNENQKNKQCGLCGHYDNDKENDFRMADDEETEDLEMFHRSYFLKDQECEIEEEKISEKKNYAIEESKEYYSDEQEMPEYFSMKTEKKYERRDYDEETETKTVEKTMIIEFPHRVCFSVEPLPACRSESAELNRVEKKARFACLPRSEHQTRRLLRQARKQPLNLELPVSFVQAVRVPQACEVY